MMRGWDDPPVTVEANQWVAQPDAADILGVSVLRVGMLIANGHLEPVERSDGYAGVSRTSVEDERRWRSSTGLRKRLFRCLRDCLRWF